MKVALLLAGMALLNMRAVRPEVRADPGRAADLRVLVVGGGPSPKDNEVAIESNVRYFDKLLGPDVSRRILFADGDPGAKTVQYEDESGNTHYRTPKLRQWDGSSRSASVGREFASLAQTSHVGSGPLFLYFTGHGSPNEASNYADNAFDLWGDDELSVRRLASYIDQLPDRTPVTLVMVQCFSGAFGNLIFRNGDPKSELSDRPVCGFFAAIGPRMAAGCTPSIKEADYQDFTGYFFGALSGTDRLGHRIAGADYRHDGKVTMAEAYAYALIHDDSIDTPTCTSDTFLRRFVKVPAERVFATPWSKVRSWATPAQAAALDALSRSLDVSGENRAQVAYNRFLKINENSEDLYDTHLIRLVRLVNSVVLAHDLEASPDQELKDRFERLEREEDSNPLTQ